MKVHTEWFSIDNNLFRNDEHLTNVELNHITWTLQQFATVILSGVAPVGAKNLTDIVDGDTLALTHYEFGKASVRDTQTLVMRFLDCEVVKLWVDGSDEYVVFHAEIKCLIETFGEGL